MTKFVLSNGKQLKKFLDSSAIAQAPEYKDDLFRLEPMAIDRSKFARDEALVEFLRSDRKRQRDSGSAAEAHDTQSELALAAADEERLWAKISPNLSLSKAKAAQATLLKKRNTASKHSDINSKVESTFNRKIKALQLSERDDICKQLTGFSYNDFVESLIGAGADVVSARKKADKMCADSVRKLQAEYPATAALLVAVPEQSTKESAANLAGRFKKWAGVSPGQTMREIEARIRAANRDLKNAEIAELVNKEMTKLLQNCSKAWQSQLPDQNVLRLLQMDMSEDAQKILAEYQRVQLRAETKTPDERAVRDSRITAQNASQKMYEKYKEQYGSDLQRTLGITIESDERCDVAAPSRSGELVSIDSLRGPQSELALVARTEEGTVVTRDHYSTAIEPGVHSILHFMAAYTTNKSRSEQMSTSDLNDAKERELVQILDRYLKMLSIAPPDAIFTVDGLRPTGDHALDLREVLRRAETCEELPIDTIIAYRRHWSANYEESPLDLDRALVSRFHKIDEEKLHRILVRLGMNEQQINASFVYGTSPQTNQVMQHVMAAAKSDLFRRTQRQAMEQTNLKERVKTAENGGGGGGGRSAKSRKLSESDTAGERNVDSNVNRLLGNVSDASKLLSLEKCERAYLQRYMREPLAVYGERECVNMAQCVCRVLALQYPEIAGHAQRRAGFTCREFLLPSQERTFQRVNKLPKQRQMCVLCNRVCVTWLYHENNRKGIEHELPLHEYTVLVEKEGEYGLHACLDVTQGSGKLTGIVGPFVRFSASDYVYSKMDVGERSVMSILETNSLDFRLRSDRDPRI